MAKSISFGGKSFKVSKAKLAAVPTQLNGTMQGGANAHPWANPIETLFGSWEDSQDLPDFFKDTSKKKSVHQRALTISEVINLIQESWDPMTQKVDVGSWKTLLGDVLEPEGSAFSCKELEEIGYKTREHYALVSVASGFDWSARGINLYPLMSDLGTLDLLPSGCAAMWHTTILICLWCVYEAFGLGGLNYTALSWHGWMRSYAKSGEVADKLLDEQQQFERDSCVSHEAFLRKYWVQLLEGEGIRAELVHNDQVWQNVLFLATGREIVAAKANGYDYSKHLQNYTFGGLSLEDIEFLVLSAAAQRGAAKGRLSIHEGDDYEQPTGIIATLCKEQYNWYWDKLQSVNYPSVGSQMLMDVFVIVEDWSTLRSAIISKDNDIQ